jgi:hypothetical protein
MENLSHISASLRDVVLRLDRMQADIARLTQQKVPDRFVPLLEATRHLHCGRDWLVAQIKAVFYALESTSLTGVLAIQSAGGTLLILIRRFAG